MFFFQKELDKNIATLSNALTEKNFCAGKDATVIHEVNLANDDLKMLSSAFGTRFDSNIVNLKLLFFIV